MLNLKQTALPNLDKEKLEALVQFRSTPSEKAEFQELAGDDASTWLRWSFQQLIQILKEVKNPEEKAS